MLIPEIPITQFKKLRVEEIKQLKSCVLTSDGEYLCTLIIPRTDFVQVRAEYLGVVSNSVGGVDLELFERLVEV